MKNFKLNVLTLLIGASFSHGLLASNTTANHNNNGKIKFTADSVIVVYKKQRSNNQKAAVRAMVENITTGSSQKNSNGFGSKYGSNGYGSNYGNNGFGSKYGSNYGNNKLSTKSFTNLNGGVIETYKLNGRSIVEAMKALKQHPDVEFVEPNYMLYPSSTPNDPHFDKLWGMHNKGQTIGVFPGTVDADIDATEAWEISKGSKEVVIGVIDTGIDYNHPDLKENMWVNPNEIAGNGIDDDNNGYIDDVHGISAINDDGDPMDTHFHGTHVAGTIGAVGNNGIGVVGVAQQVSIAGCSFLSAQGGTTADAIECINYFVGLKKDGVNIKATNNSWGGGGNSKALEAAIKSSTDAGMLFIVAAGNSSTDLDELPDYPGSYTDKGIVNVAATNNNDGLADFSNFGEKSVDIAAPGVNIFSTIPDGKYGFSSGTSMAAPMVTGTAALAWSYGPLHSASEMKDTLMNVGDSLEKLEGKVISGKRINASNTVKDADPTPGFKFKFDSKSQVATQGDTVIYNVAVNSVHGYKKKVKLTLDSAISKAKLSKKVVKPGGEVKLRIPTSTDIPWGHYEFTVNGVSKKLKKSEKVRLFLHPKNTFEAIYTRTEADVIPKVKIPDVDDLPEAAELNVRFNVTETDAFFNGKLELGISHESLRNDILVVLTSPDGKDFLIKKQEEDLQYSYNLSTKLNGTKAQGEWTITIVNVSLEHSGVLDRLALIFDSTEKVTDTAPEADFKYDVDLLNVNFTNLSSDKNNDITSWQWDFGDNSTSNEQHPKHTYNSAGEYTVTLTVTDANNNTDKIIKNFTVFYERPTLKLVRTDRNGSGWARFHIEWSGAKGETVKLYFGNDLHDTIDNDGKHIFISQKVYPSYKLKLCDAQACSNIVITDLAKD